MEWDLVDFKWKKKEYVNLKISRKHISLKSEKSKMSVLKKCDSSYM